LLTTTSDELGGKASVLASVSISSTRFSNALACSGVPAAAALVLPAPAVGSDGSPLVQAAGCEDQHRTTPAADVEDLLVA
jgi:hypothetical protein